jgi:hypothetical protein
MIVDAESVHVCKVTLNKCGTQRLLQSSAGDGLQAVQVSSQTSGGQPQVLRSVLSAVAASASSTVRAIVSN